VLSTLICAHGFFTCAQPQKESKAAIKISVVNEDFVGHFIRNYGPISKLLNCRLVFQRELRKKLPGWIGDGEKLRSTVYVFPFHAPNTKIDH
jgi:hypothetical protein